jgi:antitoxin FitA
MLAKELAVATLTIRNVEPEMRQRLRVRAAQNGRSMEAELRHILKDVLRSGPEERQLNLAQSIRQIVEPFGGIEVEIPPREPTEPPPKFDE